MLSLNINDNFCFTLPNHHHHYFAEIDINTTLESTSGPQHWKNTYVPAIHFCRNHSVPRQTRASAHRAPSPVGSRGWDGSFSVDNSVVKETSWNCSRRILPSNQNMASLCKSTSLKIPLVKGIDVLMVTHSCSVSDSILDSFFD